ncbi:hypothetical protein [Salinigranum rubrum]|uniref:hypothetical protein n=1 Tax=Salinigranum rubrum TaxID=755307 RepID=UPI001C200F4E|nr:hypothetical protein [Salinigranum rubrum]
MNRRALASDSFVYAKTLTAAKCNPLSEEEFEVAVDDVLTEAEALTQIDIQDVDDDVALFFHKKTLQEILPVREILKKRGGTEANFLNALTCGVLHGPSEMFLSLQTKDTFSGSANYVRKYIDKNDIHPEYRNIEKSWNTKFNTLDSSRYPKQKVKVEQGDSTDLPFAEGEADLLLTSPPYMHMLDYSWNNWLRLWWLDADRKAERDDMNLTSALDNYRSFIQDTLNEVDHVLSDDSWAIIVIGDVRRHRSEGSQIVYPSFMIAAEAEKRGFELERVIDDAYNIDKRSYSRFNDLRYEVTKESEDGEELLDRILILKKGNPESERTSSMPWS